MNPRMVQIFACALLCAVASGCGDDPPTAPSVTVTRVQLGVSGGASTVLAPGDTRQLFATALDSNGTTTDVTTLATWQSSNPAAGAVSGNGTLTAAGEGSVDITATYQSVRGSLRVDIRRPSCDLTISPPTASFTAFGGTSTLQVSVSPADCRWSPRASVAWLSLDGAERTGSGSVSYTVAPNSGVADRNSTVTIAAATGQSAAHQLTQARPLGCSYVLSPDTATFSSAGGSGVVDVVTTPGDCQWRTSTTLGSFGVLITSEFSGTGSGRIRYTVQSHTRTVDVDGFLEVAGLSGLNPPGRQHIIIQKR